jgi:drug/metabolite transporter (DMT)-like permease
MVYLILVSVIWAFSFGLTKGQLAGVDSALISAVRLALAFLVFVPLTRLRGLSLQTAGALAGIGAVQFGVMYLALNESYRYLQAYEVVLFTLTTPIMVTLLADALDRRFRPRALFAALLAIIGAGFVAFKSTNLQPTLAGLLLIQGSNAAFATGQVLYRRVRRRHPEVKDASIFALLYAGAMIVALGALLLKLDSITLVLTGRQLATLAYLGILASGVCFFLWNVGATRVGAGTLAVMNNAKVPLGVACSLIFFGERAYYPSLFASLALMAAAVWLARERTTTSS